MKPLFVAVIAATYALTGVGVTAALERHRVMTESGQERVHHVKIVDSDVPK